MELILKDKDLVSLGIVDISESLIWTDRFYECGDFEIYTEINEKNVSLFVEDYYLIKPDSKKIMIIESVEIKSNSEFGNKLLIKGRSFESVLGRRIVWNQTILNGNLQTEIRRLLNENLITPTISERSINNFIFELSTDPSITTLSIDTQLHGEDLYDFISKICKQKGIGFEVYLNTLNQFVFRLYSGTDRSYGQIVNPFVVFSQDFDNIISSNFYRSSENHKTVALVGGEGEGINRITKEFAFPGDETTGIGRKEIFIDARDISSDVNGGTLTLSEYKQLLELRGFLDLFEYRRISRFEGKADTSKVYVYGEDFKLGDIVEYEDEYGNSGRTIVSEIIFSETISGIEIYPSFISIE